MTTYAVQARDSAQHRALLVDAIDVAFYPGITRTTLHWWVREGWLQPAGKRGRAHLYRFGDVYDLWRGRCPSGVSAAA